MSALDDAKDPIPSGAFTTTHWSVLAAAADTQAPEARAALEQLCRVYWPPVYRFVRRTTSNPEDARDLTQGFFADLIERKSFSHADRDRGKFRSFLLASVKNFMAHERERAQTLKRGGGQTFFSLDPREEEAISLEPSHTATPDNLFDQRWALQQVNHALQRLSDDYAATGRGPLFQLLQDYVWGEKNTATLAEIAGQLDLTEEAVKKAVQRLRQRFRECLRTEIAQTVSSPDQVDEELRHLRSALSGKA